MWKTTHVDWKRHIAYVEPTTLDKKGGSRWLGGGQMLSHAVCQGIRRILAADEEDSAWSRRAVHQLAHLRNEHPWVYADATSFVSQANGQVRWWTFAGGIANGVVADALNPECNVMPDNLGLNFPSGFSAETIIAELDALPTEEVRPIPNTDVMDDLKFSECLPTPIAAEVFVSRYDDHTGVQQLRSEERRIIMQ